MKWHKEVKVNKLELQLWTQKNLRNKLREKDQVAKDFVQHSVVTEYHNHDKKKYTQIRGCQP